jgi:tRNA pseudouridine55 synthase
MDLETEITLERDVPDLSEAEILSVKGKFIGKIKQLPPMYSAVKHKGKNLYLHARKGRTVEREERDIEVYDFQITGIKLPEIYFLIRCSKGSYIRVIANDFGEALGCGAVLSSLRREAIGSYSVKEAFEVEDFISIISSRAAN